MSLLRERSCTDQEGQASRASRPVNQEPVPPTRPGVKINREELAWAAGFFDGEGTAVLSGVNSTRVHPVTGRRRDYPTPHLQVTQHFDPETIHRFHRAVRGLGIVGGPYVSAGTAWHPRYQWACRRPDQVLVVVPMMWNWLSGPKRRQIATVIGEYLTDAKTRRYYRPRRP